MIEEVWPEARVTLLKRLWGEGHSAAEVARQVGGFEHTRDAGRSAVMGKLARLGMLDRGNALASAEGRPLPYADRALRTGASIVSIQSKIRMDANPVAAAVTPDASAEDAAIPAKQRRSILNIRDCECHWPVGDPLEPGFFFCGGAAEPGLPYCTRHAEIVYTAAGIALLRKKVQRRSAA